MVMTNLRVVARVIGLMLFCAALTPISAFSAERAATAAERAAYIAALNVIYTSFKSMTFGSVVSLGNASDIAFGTKDLELIIDPDLDKQATYLRPQMKLKIAEFNAGNYVTYYHEFVHRLIDLKKGNIGCGNDEAYAGLLESRYTFVYGALSHFDKESYGLIRLNKAWREIEKLWNDRQLTGPFTYEDSDKTCNYKMPWIGKVGGVHTYIISPEYISELDKVLGIDFELARIRANYKRLDDPIPSVAGKWCRNDGLTITATQTVDKITLSTDEFGNVDFVDFFDVHTLEVVTKAPKKISTHGRISANGKEIDWGNGTTWKALEPGKDCAPPRHYDLTKIEVERSFPSGWSSWNPPVEFVGGRGKTTESAGARSFKFGWNLTFGSRIPKGVSSATGEVTLSAVPASLDSSPDKTATANFGAKITGYWDMQGYAFERDHTVALSGVAGNAKWSAVGQPSRVVVSGIAATSSVARLSGSDREIVVVIHARINFGGDDWSDMDIRLIYQPPSGDALPSTCTAGRC
jgi:hypothetical protein